MEEQIYKRVPARRFPEFKNDGEWEKSIFSDVLDFLPNNTLSRADLNYDKGVVKNIHYGDVLIKFGETLDVKESGLPFITDEKNAQKASQGALKNGDVVIADTAEDEVVGKCTELKNLTNEIVVSGLHTIPVRPNVPFASSFLGFYLNSESYRKQLKPLMQGIKVIAISKGALSTTKVVYPQNPEEQKKIADCLSSMNDLISATKNKLELLKKQKNGLMQKLFPANGKTVPEIRFKEFEKDGKWKVKTLGDITYVLNRRNKSNRNLPIYSINNKGGFAPQSEQFQGLDSNRRGYDVSLYKIVTGKTFVYNPARINVGSIGYSGDIKECIVSSLYVCFKTIDEMDDDFLMCLLGTSCFRQGVENNVEGGIRNYLFYENFSKIKIMLPSFSEQKKISLCLKAVDAKISSFSCKIAELEFLKKGVLQGVFPTTI